MKKSNAKSIRLSDKVLNYIMAYRGEGFNEKFENIILDAMESEDARLKSLEHYDMLIAGERERYFAMRDKLRSLEPMVQGCLHINSRIRELDRQFDDCISKLSGESWQLQKD